MKKVYLYILILVAVMAGCNEKIDVQKAGIEAPSIHSFSPKAGEVGTEITILGENLTAVDSVWIGETLASIRYRVSENKLVAKVLSGNQSGVITVRNVAGKSSSDGSFEVQYKQPVVNEYPVKATVYDQVVLMGENLHFVTVVLLGEDTASIVAQRKNELVFVVPFHDDEAPVTLRLSYFDGEKEQLFGPEGATFVIEKQKPLVTVCPDSVVKYQPVRLEGEHLNLIEKLYADTLQLEIRLQNESMVEFDVPANFFDGPFTAPLKAIYYGTKELTIAETFRVVCDPNEPRYNTYKNVVLSGREGSGGTEQSFFDGETGLVISSCEAEDQMMAIDFLLYDNSGYAQLYSPSNATNTLKNYKCEGQSITAANPTAWNAFYQVDTKFRVLNPANEAQKAVIDAFEAGTIVKLDDELFAGISLPSSKAPKVYQSSTDASCLSVDNYPYAWVHNFVTNKDGIMKVTGTKTDAEKGKTYEVTMDIIWEK